MLELILGLEHSTSKASKQNRLIFEPFRKQKQKKVSFYPLNPLGMPKNEVTGVMESIIKNQ